MKKIFLVLFAVIMMIALVACGEKNDENVTSTNIDANTNTVSENTEPITSKGIAPANNGTLTISKDDLAVVVNGTSVKMPYKLKELESAGVPADESRNEIKLDVGGLFSANLYLDDNEDYLLIPAYQNKGDAEINLLDAEAEEITMTTYADNPADQGVSIFGIPFGMARKDVKNLLGEPKLDDGSYFEWHLEIPDMSYEGTLSLYVTEDADDAGVSQVNLTVFAK